ncbi:MAG TPA: CHAT domain-containing tetratricopeptide repeat protein [Steroidobacteraceae bacterium]
MGACLLVSCRQAGDLPAANAQHKAREYAWALLRKVQDEVGPAAHELRDAGLLVTLGLAESRNDPRQRGDWLEAQWFYYLLNDDHSRARDAIAASQQLAIDTHAGADRIADITNNLSYSLILLGEVAQAKESLRQAIVMASQHDRVVLGDLYFSMGDAYRKTGERLIARRYFEAAYEIDDAAGDESQQRVSELRLGSLARDAGDYQEAVKRHERALAGFRREGKYRELVTQIELARDHAALGNFALAEQYATAALHDRRALIEQRMDAKVLLLRIANDRRAAGQATAADVRRACALLREIEAMIAQASAAQRSEFSHPTRQLQFYEQAIRHDALDGDLAQIEQHGPKAIRLVNEVAAGLRTANDDSLAWLSSAQPLLNEYVSAMYRLDRAQVFPLLEAFYGQPVAPGALRHSGVVGRAFETQAVALFERYRLAQQKIIDATAEAERLKALGDEASHSATAKLEIERLSLERDLVRDAYLALYATQPAPSPPVKQPVVVIHDTPSVPASDVLIRYFVQEQVSFGVLLAGGRTEYFELPPRSAVMQLIHDALAVVEKPTQGDFDRAPLAALAQLLPPGLVAKYSAATRLIIVPDDAIQPAPFAAIDLAARGQPYAPLAARFELVRTRSATRYYANAGVPPAPVDPMEAPLDVAIFANPLLNAPPIAGAHLGRAPIPRWAERLPQLPKTQEEALRIAQTFATRRVARFLAADATNDALLSARVRAARILHIATHGYFSSSTPDLVGLATSATTVAGIPQGGFLGLTELFTQPFASRLVVISGCETMRGRDYTGWGVRSLADGFLTQGAGSVIGMLWSVSDDATAAVMDGFYRELDRSSGNSSLALRKARTELLESQRFRHPYYWAGLVLESSNRSIDQHVL